MKSIRSSGIVLSLSVDLNWRSVEGRTCGEARSHLRPGRGCRRKPAKCPSVGWGGRPGRRESPPNNYRCYQDLSKDYFDRLDRDRLQRHHVHRLEAPGYEVSLKSKAA